MNAPTGKIEADTLIGALAKALPELESAKKNKTNPAFKSKYADLAAIIEALEPLRTHGLWYRQVLFESPEGVTIETLYIHENGEQLSAGTLFMPAAKKDAQGFGSAMSYARRYALQAAFGLATEDDDGNATSRTNKTQDEPGMPDAEFALLTQLIEATKSDAGKMLKAYGVGNLRQLSQDQFLDARDKLEAKLAKMARDESNAKAKESADA